MKLSVWMWTLGGLAGAALLFWGVFLFSTQGLTGSPAASLAVTESSSGLIRGPGATQSAEPRVSTAEAARGRRAVVPGPPGPRPVLAVGGQHVYVLRDRVLFKYDRKNLKLLDRAEVPTPIQPE